MKSNPFAQSYLFHFHTDFTDGNVSVKQYFDYAKRDCIETLVFLEHIRRRPKYDLERFLTEIGDCERSHSVRAILGFEAKLLPEGDLDISDEHLSLATVVGIAEHGFPDQAEILAKAFVRALDRLRSKNPEKILVWVHPGLWFKRKGVRPKDQPLYRSMMKSAQEARVLIERNLKYNLIELQEAAYIERTSIVTGIDAHRLEDLHRREPNEVRTGESTKRDLTPL